MPFDCKCDMVIRKMRPEEFSLLPEFLYQAIYLPDGVQPPPRSVVELPELQVYFAGFGARSGDHCLVAEAEGRAAGAVWSRIMEDYGHIDDVTPSLAISVLPEYRGQGIGTQLLDSLLHLLQEKGYLRASLSVQKQNPALRLYERAGFRIVAEKGAEYLMLRDISPLEQEENESMKQTRETYREAKIRQWFCMWLDMQDTGICELFSPDALYIESWGPQYRGSQKIKLWFDEWNTRGTVRRWDILQLLHDGEQTVVQWSFQCVFSDKTAQSFDGLSLVRWDGGKIGFLQEFGCSQGRYDPYAQGGTPVFQDRPCAWL